MLFYAFYFYYQFASRQREGERKERERETLMPFPFQGISLSLNAVAFFLVKQMIIYANVSSRRKESKQKRRRRRREEGRQSETAEGCTKKARHKWAERVTQNCLLVCLVFGSLNCSPSLSHVLSLFFLFVLTCFCHLFCLSRCALLFITNYYYVLLSVGHLLSPAISFTQKCPLPPSFPCCKSQSTHTHTHTVLLLAFLT